MDEMMKLLIVKMQSGDEAVFDRLYHTYAGKLGYSSRDFCKMFSALKQGQRPGVF